MKWFWYQKTMIGRWGANLSDTAPTAVGTDGSKKLPLGPVYDLEKLTKEQPGHPFDEGWVELTDLDLNALIRRFPPPGDEGSAAVERPAPPLPPLPPAEAPVAPPLVPEAPVAPERTIAMSPLLVAPYGLGIEGIRDAYAAFVRLRLNPTHPRREETHAALWKMKMGEGFRVISELEPGAAVDRHIARAAELIPGWVEDFDAFQRVSPEIV